MSTYTTVQGDTWDTIAFSVYGDEMWAERLMQTRENIPLLDIQVFPNGISVVTPDVTEENDFDDDIPEWRKDDDDEEEEEIEEPEDEI